MAHVGGFLAGMALMQVLSIGRPPETEEDHLDRINAEEAKRDERSLL